MRMLILIPLLAFIPFHAQAIEVYKWTDADGTAQFSDAPRSVSAGQSDVVDLPIKPTLSSSPPTPERSPAIGLRRGERKMLEDFDRLQAEETERRDEHLRQTAKVAADSAALCREYTQRHSAINTKAKVRRAARTQDARLRMNTYRLAKLSEYRGMMNEYCD